MATSAPKPPTAAQLQKWKDTTRDTKASTKNRLAAAKNLYDHYKTEGWKNVIDTLTETQAKETKLASDIAKWRETYNSKNPQVTNQQKLEAAQNLAATYKTQGNASALKTWNSNVSHVQLLINKATTPTGGGTGGVTTPPVDTTDTDALITQIKIAQDKLVSGLQDQIKNTTDQTQKDQLQGSLTSIQALQTTGMSADQLQKVLDTLKVSTAGLPGDAANFQSVVTQLTQQTGTVDTGQFAQWTAAFDSWSKTMSSWLDQQKTVVQQQTNVYDLPDSISLLRSMFSDYGLAGLADTLAKYQTDPKALVNGKLNSDYIMADLKKQPEYVTRFQAKIDRDNAIKAARDAGTYTTLTPISEADQLGLEKQYSDLARQAGLPAGFYDNPQDFTNLIKNDVSPDEYSTRINMAQQAALQSNADLRGQLQTRYGLSDGGLTAFYLDANRAQEVTANMTNEYVRQFNQAALQGAGFSGEAAAAAAQAASPSAVNASALAQQGQSLIGLTKESVGGETAATSEQQLANVLISNIQGNQGQPNYQDTAQVQESLKRRAARYQGGGQIATSAQGVVGLTQAKS